MSTKCPICLQEFDDGIEEVIKQDALAIEDFISEIKERKSLISPYQLLRCCQY